MEAVKHWARSGFLYLIKLFAHSDRASEKKFFGFGQFVLLLTLAPFIFNLSLYSFGTEEEVPSHYEYNPNRFEPLPDLQTQLPPPAFSNYITQLTPTKRLSKKEKQKLIRCNFWKLKTKNCTTLSAKQKKYNEANAKASKQYWKGYRKYLADHHNYTTAQAKYKAEVITQYRAFKPGVAKPEPLPAIGIKQYVNASYIAILEQTAGSGTWEQATFPIWLLGALLIFPAIIAGIKRQLWGLLAFGLAIPTFNYLLSIPNLLLGWGALSHWQLTNIAIPQLAFCYFALKGQIRSKSFFYFVLLMIACSFLPLLSNIHEGFSVIKAQLPLLVFIAVAAIARLIVKGARENAYLLQNLDWSRGIKTGLHALLLWLPMAALATPFLYLTEVVIPKNMIDHLHEEQVLVFDHTHALGLLDNALQSTALKTDDIVYAWHMKTQATKKAIYDKKMALTEANLTKISQEKFDEIVPEDLAFEEHDSDVPLVGWIVNLSVDASQASTNKVYQTFRQSMKDNLKESVTEVEGEIKDSVNNNVGKAFSLIDQQYAHGKSAILQANHNAQTSLWWTINYVHALHQLTLLIFAFICIKSFMYVFARVSFNRDTGSFVTLGNTKEATKKNVKALIKPTGREYLISGHKDETYYISRQFQCRGKAPKFTIPQALHAPIARLLSGAYTMNKMTMHKGDEQVSCSATKGMEFFEWSLAKGEAVILDFHHFVGMSESIQISTLISPRMSSLLLGKMIFSQATGPGKLILMTKGRAEVIDNKGAAGSLPPERIVAMHKSTKLHIDSELDPLNIYLSTAYIRSAGGGKIIVDVDSQRGAKTGLASFIKHFILPV